ncbi:MAG: tetratricopeptide repeat protein [Chitinophagaceae bacterium]
MKRIIKIFIRFVFILLAVSILSCNNKNSSPSTELISQLNLKRGDIISCGPPDAQFGLVDFDVTCDEKVKNDFNLAIELLHSFEYDESEKVFAKIIDKTPDCAMAYWGVAMCNFHALWTPPTEAELIKGAKAIAIAKSVTNKSARESAYINALGLFYKDWKTIDHLTRCGNWADAMDKLHTSYPDDKEAAIFYALSLDAAANSRDKTYANQKKAGSILEALYKAEPNHPGVIHYIIHTYDYPELASLALPAAKRYAEVAPSSAHALHMPSHIFTRLGLWDECIHSNLKSIEAAQCYAEQADIPGHWDEELHGLDYLVYAYLQKGNNADAEKQVAYLNTIKNVYPLNFKVAYAFAAVPCRFMLENKQWKESAALKVSYANLSWNNFPWQEAIIHFTRLLGNVHINNLGEAKLELVKLNQLLDTLQKQKDSYKSMEVSIQIKAAEAWIQFTSGNKKDALDVMKLAADMEDRTGKHPVTPGEVPPARELLADMFLQMNENQNALQAYEEVLKQCPNRFNSLYGAGRSAENFGDKQKAIYYYKQLSAIIGATNSDRHELIDVRKFLARH